jgi:hypothetical protein
LKELKQQQRKERIVNPDPKEAERKKEMEMLEIGRPGPFSR